MTLLQGLNLDISQELSILFRPYFFLADKHNNAITMIDPTNDKMVVINGIVLGTGSGLSQLVGFEK